MAVAAPSLCGLLILSACGGGDAVPADGPHSVSPMALAPAVAATPVPASADSADLIASALVLFVAPQGDDGWTGTTAEPDAAGRDGPLRTLNAAQAAVRRKLADMASGRAARRPIRVQVLPGTFALREPLVFTDADSGTADAPVVFEARTSGTVILSGGEALSRSASTEDQVVFRPPASTNVDWRTATQLFVDGRRATLARQPDAGTFWFVRGALSTPQETGAANPGRRAFAASREAVRWMDRLDGSDRERAFVHVYHSWTTSRHRMDGAPDGESVHVTPAARWPFLTFGLSQRYYIENVRAALDAPGEWYGDGAGVTYLPRGGEDVGTLSAVIPVTDRLIVLRGNVAAGRWVEHLQLRGFALQHTSLDIPRSGFIDPQAAVRVGAAVEIDGARHLLIEGMHLSQLGGYGIWLRSNVVDSVVRDNVLGDLGAGGIRIGLDAQPRSDAHPTARIRVASNTVVGTGRLLPGAVGIWLGQTWDNVVEHNLVADTTYTGISVGWQWGYGAPTSGRNIVRGNLLYNIGKGTLADLGGIYTLGPSPGTVIARNLVREVRGYPGYGPGGGGAWGIYHDEGTSGTSTEDNVILGTGSGGHHLHYGRDNVLRRNVFAGGEQSELRVTRTDPTRTQLDVRDNLFLPRSAHPFDGFATAPDTAYFRNLVGGALATGPVIDLANCGDGCTTTRIGITASQRPKDITLLDAPPAWADPVAAIVEEAGPARSRLYGERLVIQDPSRPSLAPPVDWSLDIGGAAVGSQPRGLVYHPPADLAAVGVVEQEGAPESGKCLRLTDRAGLENRWDPHVFAWLNHDRGNSSAEFSLWIDERSDVTHEWRDDARPYRVGPSLRVTAAGVQIDRQLVAPVAVRGWTRFRVTAGLGASAGRWSLEVIGPDGEARHLDGLHPGSADWQALKWLGFVSNAVAETSVCLAKLSVETSVR
jgi:hypothetical protein